jgi:S-DNA-T family DNA segregation ATPase FtsK/SpoIIIE
VTQSSPSTTIAPAGNWQIPPIADVLDPAAPTAVQTTVDNERAKIIEETLKGFGAPGHVVEIHRGPTITQFGVEPDFIEGRSGKMRVRVNRIASLSDDLALALSAQRIRIQAPVPGRSYVGIEVPNIENSLVSLREVMESESFRRIRSSLRIALGKDVAGKPISADLTAMPHLLIAGTTGSGKSVCVNSILSCLLLNNTPVDLRLVLVDPKRVELTGYNGIPHLLAPVVVEAERVIGALQWILREMDSRYHRFSQEKVRNIQEYNKSHEDRLPYLVVVIDELADLMMLAPDETERRATGIHLIIATQRPSVDVVTGLIKANFPARIAFAVASNTDSRVILDQPGAERLLGRGDMLFQAPDAPAPVRLQGVYVSDGEIQRLTETWRLNTMQNRAAGGEGSPDQIDTLPRGVPLIQAPLFDSESVSGEDPLLQEAIAIVRREKKASISMLQRRMRIGYTRSARLIDTMESKGIISPSSVNSQVREVLDFGDEEQSDNGES